MTPTPEWAQCHIEVYEAPGWLDDCFRSGLWTKFQSAASESFANANDISGDYATMAVTEGDPVNGCGWRKDISGLGLSTDTYPYLRVRLRGRGTTPQYKLGVEYTDSSENETGWVDAPTGFEAVTFGLVPGHAVKYVKLYARCNTPLGSAQIDYDYAVILSHWPLIPSEHLEVDVDLQTTLAVSGFRFKAWQDVLQGVTARRYKFDENMGTKVFDLSNNKCHGSVVNATWNSSGKFNSCLYFLTASSCRVDTGYKPTIAATGALSIALWVKASSGAIGVIIGSGKVSGGSFNRVQLNFQDTNKIRVYVKDDAGNIRQYTSTKVVLDDTWHHVIAVVDPANDRVQLYIDGAYDGQATGTLGAITLDTYDFTIGCLHNESGYSNYITGYVDEPAIYEKALSASEVYRIFKQDPMSGIARAGTGSIAMIYLAAEPESLVYKLVKGRIIDKVTGGDPDQPYIEFVGEDLGELLHERSWTKEYATATQISSIVGTMIDEAADELYRDIDATNRAIVNYFRNENVWSLLGKLAEATTFATGETGANFYVDPGGALRFKKYGAFACPHAISDGSDGNSANILDITVKETMKGTPKLANDVKIIIFEEEAQPRDEDAWTESAEGWSSPDPTDSGYPQSDTGEKKSGSASIHFNTTNCGSQYRMRISFSDLDLSQYDQLKFWTKYGAGLSPDFIDVRLQKGDWIWTWDYWFADMIYPPDPATWGEISVNLADLSHGGWPSSVINHIEIRFWRISGNLGTGGFLIDKLRFIRNEKAATASDSTSQASYGKRSHVEIDKTITDIDYAGYVAGNILEHRKDPLVTVHAKVPGRGQLGYRPPQMVTVTSLKDGLNQKSFQIQRARHLYRTSEGYTCELEMVAARKPNGTYEPKVAPASVDLSGVLAEMQRRQYEGLLNSLRTAWE